MACNSVIGSCHLEKEWSTCRYSPNFMVDIREKSANADSKRPKNQFILKTDMGYTCIFNKNHFELFCSALSMPMYPFLLPASMDTHAMPLHWLVPKKTSSCSRRSLCA